MVAGDGSQGAATAHLDTMALRFAGGLMLFGGGLLLLAALGLGLLPYDAASSAYALPGGVRRMSIAAPRLLAGSGGLLALTGGAAVLAGGLGITAGALRRLSPRGIRAAVILFAGLAVLAVALARR